MRLFKRNGFNQGNRSLIKPECVLNMCYKSTNVYSLKMYKTPIQSKTGNAVVMKVLYEFHFEKRNTRRRIEMSVQKHIPILSFSNFIGDLFRDLLKDTSFCAVYDYCVLFMFLVVTVVSCSGFYCI